MHRGMSAKEAGYYVDKVILCAYFFESFCQSFKLFWSKAWLQAKANRSCCTQYFGKQGTLGRQAQPRFRR